MKILMPWSLIFVFVIATSAYGGTKGSGPSSPSSSSGTPSSNSGTGGGGGGTSIESEAIAYQAARKISDEIVGNTIFEIEHEPAPGCPITHKILLADPTSQLEIASFESFKSQLATLAQGYASLGPGGAAPLGSSPTDWMTSATNLLTAIRNTADSSVQTFQPDDTVLASLHANGFAEQNYTLITSQTPGNLVMASIEITALLKSVSDARSRVTAANQKGSYFQALDVQFTAIQTSLNTADSTGNSALTTILNGQALSDSLGVCYAQVFAKTVAAGGGSRIVHIFLMELFVPTLKPAFNGGAIVSYNVVSGDGKPLDSNTLYYVYNYNRWSSPKVDSYKNF